MHTKQSLILLTLAAYAINLSISASSSGPKWNYIRGDDDGPENWKYHFTQCNHKKNSPIDLPTDRMDSNIYGTKAEKWDLTNWGSESRWTVLDTHFAVKYSLEDGQSIKTAGGGLDNTYDVLQFHLHWGGDDSKGSEHTLGGKSYPMELHFVHKNSKYSTIDLAINSEDSNALAAVGFFFEIQPNDNPALAPLVQAAKDVRGATNYTIEGVVLDIDNFVKEAMKGTYYRYFGGLTTPGCQEIVEWTVFEKPIGISSRQMELIRTQSDSSLGYDFYREVQDLNGREVTVYDANYEPSAYGAASFSSALSSLTLLSILITKLL